jgi:hypothetical protein
MASEVIRQLDIAQDHRRLSAEEFQLRKELKCRGLGLASLERSRRLVWLKEGDECTRFFHLSRKNFIHQLKSDDGTYAWTHDQKEKILFDHFNQSLGTKEQRQAYPAFLQTTFWTRRSLNQKSGMLLWRKRRDLTVSPTFSIATVGT